MTAGTRRRLPSLEKMIAAYSVKAWYTVPSAHGVRGVDPNAPREPSYFGPRVRLAARIVDELVGGHPANLGACDCPPCGCAVWELGAKNRPTYRPCAHDLLCPHGTGREEDAEVVSRRLLSLMSRLPHLRALFDLGVEKVYEAARLTVAEARVARHRHEGLSYRTIASVIGREVGTVKALDSRGHQKLRALALEVEAPA